MARRVWSLRTRGLNGLSMQEASTLMLCETLLDFAAAPGRHALRLREPALLFDELDLVALWALGRVPEGLSEPQAVRQAALLFVLRACFAPGLNHYQLLGLPPSFAAGQLRTRYRALIRLTHPDMGIEGLPLGAAGMVNRAHAVLADAAQRAVYDRQLLTQLPPAAALPTGAGLEAGRMGATVVSATDWRLTGSRWPGVRHVVSMQLVHMVEHMVGRRVVAVGVLLLGAVMALGWAMRGSGTNSRLVANDQSVSAVKPGAPEPETVRLRIPVQWSKGIDVPVANVQVPNAPVSDMPWPGLTAKNGPVPPPSLVPRAAGPALPEASSGVAAPSPVAAAPVSAAPVITASVAATPVTAVPVAAAPLAAAPAAAAPVKAAPALVMHSSDAPSGAGRSTVWDVDVPSARTYLQDLLSQLALPEQARTTSHALAQMNVHGSLLMPPGAVGDAMRSVQIERADLNESHRPGVLRIRGLMWAHVSSVNSKPRAVRWRVQAEFKGTAQGTVLTLLDLGDSE